MDQNGKIQQQVSLGNQFKIMTPQNNNKFRGALIPPSVAPAAQGGDRRALSNLRTASKEHSNGGNDSMQWFGNNRGKAPGARGNQRSVSRPRQVVNDAQQYATIDGNTNASKRPPKGHTSNQNQNQMYYAGKNMNPNANKGGQHYQTIQY